MSMWQRALVEKRNILVPLLVGIIANIVLYVVVVFPLGHTVVKTERDERTAREQLLKARQDFNGAKATVTGKAQADAALQRFYKEVLPSDGATARRITYTRLAELAHQANVKLEHGTNNVVREKDSSLSKLTTTYLLSGDYRNIRKFIYAIETAPEFIVIENVGLQSAGEQAQQQNRGLAMSLDIATYFRTGNGGQ